MHLFSLHRLMDEVNGEGNDLGGGADTTIDAGTADAGTGADAGASGAVEKDIGAGMLGAIKEGLAGGDNAIQAPGTQASAAAQAVGDATTQGQPKPGDKPAADPAAEAKARDEALAKKKPTDFVLTDQEKAVLGPKAQARFQELTHYGKIQHERAERVQQENQQLTGARDNILKTFADAKASPDDIASLLDLNYRVKTGDLEGALKVVNNTRADLLKALGREEPGVDLLAEHADLKARVDNQEISRADALELANTRRANAVQQQQQHQTQQQNEQQKQVEQSHQTALAGIQKWCAEKSKSDIDYPAREAKVQDKIAGIMKQYPPNLWLPTIQALYDAVTVTKAPVVNIGANSLRPNGAKPGAKAPNSMLDAIKNGLGYSAAG